jgi:hypothetical protein
MHVSLFLGRRAQAFSLLFALLSTLSVSACRDGVIAEYRFVLDLDAKVLSAEGQPLGNLPLLLRDRKEPHGVFRRQRLRAVCVTNRSGMCSAHLSYGYGRSEPVVRDKTAMKINEQFEIIAQYENRFVSLGFLPIDDPAQVQGYKRIDFHAVLRRSLEE